MFPIKVHATECEVMGTARLRSKTDRFRVSCFQKTSDTPAPMCDGGDWVKTLELKLCKDEKTVSIYWRREEQSKHHRVDLPYTEFFDKFADFMEVFEKDLKRSKKS